MKYTVLFLTILAISSFTSTIRASAVFEHVKSLLTSFKSDITKEQSDADDRNKRDTAECDDRIRKQQDLVNQRTKDVDDVKAHIKFLENEITENEKDKKHREDRIAANLELLKKFKEERCANNLIFVKQLREHIEALDILGELRKELLAYFAAKKNGSNPATPAFIERFSEFSHLLNEEHKQIFLELSTALQDLPDVKPLDDATKDATKTKQRTDEETGTQHVDNNKGELQKLDHVAHTEVPVYASELEKKVLLMIDSLSEHLRESRRRLEKDEIQAAEDFAKFQTNVENENTHLLSRIEEIKKVLISLRDQLNNANDQLKKRQELLKQAIDELNEIKRICKEKTDYYVKENARRASELSTVDKATSLFVELVEKKLSRVMERADNLINQKEAGNDLTAHVVPHEKETNPKVADNKTNRKDVVFF